MTTPMADLGPWKNARVGCQAGRRLPMSRRNYPPVPQSPHRQIVSVAVELLENAWPAHLVACVWRWWPRRQIDLFGSILWFSESSEDKLAVVSPRTSNAWIADRIL